MCSRVQPRFGRRAYSTRRHHIRRCHLLLQHPRVLGWFKTWREIRPQATHYRRHHSHRHRLPHPDQQPISGRAAVLNLHSYIQHTYIFISRAISPKGSIRTTFAAMPYRAYAPKYYSVEHSPDNIIQSAYYSSYLISPFYNQDTALMKYLRFQPPVQM